MRKPIGITTARRTVMNIVYTDILAVCDDGSMWVMMDTEWSEGNPIPGTERADYLKVTKFLEVDDD